MSAARKTNIGFNAAAYDSWFETPLGRLCGTLETASILNLAELKQRELVLDLGCGTGFFTLELARRGATVIGVDASAEMLNAAKTKAAMEKLPISFHLAQADSLPFASQSFDLVVGVTVLCYAEQPDLILREANRLLKDSGRIVVGELNRLSYWSRLRKAKALFHETSYQHARFLSPTELKQLLWQTGFAVRDNETRIFFPPTNWSPVIKQYSLFERAGGVLFPSHGAFVGMKADKQLPC